VVNPGPTALTDVSTSPPDLAECAQRINDILAVLRGAGLVN
jgi:hypothetical protein